MAIIQAVGEHKFLAKVFRGIASTEIMVLIGEVTITMLRRDVACIPVRARQLWTNGYMSLCVRCDGVDHIGHLVGLLNHNLKNWVYYYLNFNYRK